MATEQLFFVGVKGLIQDAEGKILLLLADVSKHRGNTEPYWDIPGGRIQEGDSVLETLKREILEETGITIVTPVFKTAVISNHQVPTSDNQMAGLVLMVYMVSTPSDSELVISEEHNGYEWVSRAVAKERLRHKYPKEFTDVL